VGPDFAAGHRGRAARPGRTALRGPGTGPQRTPLTWFPFGAPPHHGVSTSVAHDPTVTVADASIKVGATELAVGAGPQLASIQGQALAGAAPVLTVDVSRRLGGRDGDRAERLRRSGRPGQTLDVSLDRAATWRSIRLEVGAVDGRIDSAD